MIGLFWNTYETSAVEQPRDLCKSCFYLSINLKEYFVTLLKSDSIVTSVKGTVECIFSPLLWKFLGVSGEEHELNPCKCEFVTASYEAYTTGFCIVLSDQTNGLSADVSKNHERCKDNGWELIKRYIITDRGVQQTFDDEVVTV